MNSRTHDRKLRPRTKEFMVIHKFMPHLGKALSYPHFNFMLHLRSIHIGGGTTRRLITLIKYGFVGISTMRTHRAFPWMCHDVSEMKNSIFDATLCLGTIGKVSEVG